LIFFFFFRFSSDHFPTHKICCQCFLSCHHVYCSFEGGWFWVFKSFWVLHFPRLWSLMGSKSCN
jgi:hypothetical protein